MWRRAALILCTASVGNPGEPRGTGEGSNRGAPAQLPGCTVPSDIPTYQNGDDLCYDFEGCPAEYPTKACTYNGGHESSDSRRWIAKESWDFFMQF